MKRTLASLSLLFLLSQAACGAAEPESPAKADAVAEPDTSAWKTWVLPSPDAVRVAQPANERAGDAPPGDEVLGEKWLELAMDYVSQRAKDPPAASRAYALVAVAQYDALVSARHWSREFTGSESGSPTDQAAVAGAASRVLAYLFPEQPALRLDQEAEQAAGDDQAGLELGREVADRVIAYARTDGSETQWDGSRPPLQPSFWAPPPGSVSPPVAPLAGNWRTWAIESGSAYRPSAPPAYGSPEYLVEARELIDIGRSLTDDQKRVAKFWEGGEGTSLPPGVWNRVVLDYLADHPVSRAEQIRTLALVNVALADAGIAAWDAKYAYWTPRPENAIRDLLDPEWRPYLRTPLFPAYVSGHSTYSAAIAEVLAGLFPAGAVEFRRMGEEAGISRLLGGIHWRSDHVQGSRMGREIGKRVLEKAGEMTT